MNETLMVSIICNVFNHGKYLHDALDGFVMQKTNFRFEVLVHDDASTDNSASIIREYEEKYPDLIKPIYQSVNQYSQNISINLLYQIPRVQGRYVAACEGDDYWTDPLKLQKQVDFLEANPEYSMCATSTIWLDMRTNTKVPLCRTETDRDVSLKELILEEKGRIFQFATIMVKRDVFCCRPDWMALFGVGDVPLNIYAATCGKVHMLADVTAVYRNHASGSVTAKMSRNSSYNTSVYDKVINGLRAFNEATNYAHDSIVTKKIKMIEYNLARRDRNWKAMCSGELREIYLSRPFMARLSDVLYCMAPGLQTKIRQILGR